MQAHGNIITNLTLHNNRDGVLIQRTPSPVATSNNNRIIANRVTASTGVGIHVNGNGNLVEGNSVLDGAGNAIGIAGATSGTSIPVQNNTVSRNTVTNNALQFTGAAAIVVVHAINTNLTANVVVGVGTNPGIFVGAPPATPAPGPR